MESRKLKGALKTQIMLIGVLWMADKVFFFFEQNFLNTYLEHVLFLSPIYISIMVSLSAAIGVIFNFTWGIISDNTRSKYGRRRPFLLFGVIAGFGMILYGLAFIFFGRTLIAYIWCVAFDVLIIGITSNAFLTGERALIPDLVENKYRGRANGIVQAISYVGLIIALAFFLLGDLLFGVTDPRPGETGTIIPQDGHLILLSIGGALFAISGIIGFIFIKEKAPSELPPKKKFFAELKATFNLTDVKDKSEFYKITLAAIIFQSGISCVMPFLFIYIFDQGLDTVDLLIAIAVGFVILFPAVIGIGKVADKFGRKKFFPLLVAIVSIGYILMIFTGTGPTFNYILFVALLPFILIGLLGLDTIINTWAQDTLPENKQGQFYGIFNLVYTISQILGAFIGGIIAEFFDLQWIFAVGAVFFLLSIPLFYRVKETLVLE